MSGPRRRHIVVFPGDTRCSQVESEVKHLVGGAHSFLSLCLKPNWSIFSAPSFPCKMTSNLLTGIFCIENRNILCVLLRELVLPMTVWPHFFFSFLFWFDLSFDLSYGIQLNHISRVSLLYTDILKSFRSPNHLCSQVSSQFQKPFCILLRCRNTICFQFKLYSFPCMCQSRVACIPIPFQQLKLC